MTEQTDRNTPGSPWPWLLAAGLAFLILVGTVAGSFIYATRTVTGSMVELEIDGTTCRTMAEWTSNPTIFLRTNTVKPGEAMLAIAPYGPDGHVFTTMAVKQGVSLDIPRGTFDSIATIDLTAFDPTDEICFDIGGLEDRLTTGDLLIVGNFASPLVTAFLSSCGIGVIMAIVIGVSIVKSKRRIDAN